MIRKLGIELFCFYGVGLLRADTVEKLQIFRPDKTICVLSFLSNLTHGGDHINRDLFLQSHC
jgi:hypothetical protein